MFSLKFSPIHQKITYMKITVGILLAIVLSLGWRLSAEMEVNRQQQSHVAELTLKLNDKTTHENIELQEKCAKQADATFLQNGYKNDSLDSWQSHYNMKLGKCFMTIDSRKGLLVFKSLVDAYEHRVYASYMWKADKGKKYWEVPPFDCELITSSADTKICKNQEEYDAYVARYME